MIRLLCWTTILIGFVWLFMAENPAALAPVIIGTIGLYNYYKNRNN